MSAVSVKSLLPSPATVPATVTVFCSKVIEGASRRWGFPLPLVAEGTIRSLRDSRPGLKVAGRLGVFRRVRSQEVSIVETPLRGMICNQTHGAISWWAQSERHQAARPITLASQWLCLIRCSLKPFVAQTTCLASLTTTAGDVGEAPRNPRD